MVLRPRRQHSGFAADAEGHLAAAAAFMQAGGVPPDAAMLAARQQQAGALPSMPRHWPAGLVLPELTGAQFGQHATQAQRASGAAGGEAMLQHLLGALLQVRRGRVGRRAGQGGGVGVAGRCP